ncbi:hypothetical protein [Psychrobacter pygoscelis]|uniref:hypothetical protein n=1 Tax=Psychrobacter pygoscelis TaxID=2488563 RepID=UPI001039BC59|nr:hypothetical protein [Psychrobacter pygoscelis]
MSLLSINTANAKSNLAPYSKKAMTLATLLLSTAIAATTLSGCTTAPTVKPTVSVMTGAHKTL